ncbi:uncharacterized protein BDW43DRAFT_308875 [Aspergillus alliaceus]|uniref:uncharacterized protein n=1 Tax=Petromyces alliaceus TaxID=209559 RepID=UPI0012A6F151|nr:uncharacterized protein BDW43DRAFT_308875 [Aspergillus alliaceus]KAB8236077.1 hypothetical protein BDW43DRAFT_308875 [Aspergillus alliaceus]
MTVMTIFTAALVLAPWLPSSCNGAILTFAVTLGVGSGGGAGLGPVLIAILSPIREVGVRVGLTLTIGAIGGLTRDAIAAQDGAILGHLCIIRRQLFAFASTLHDPAGPARGSGRLHPK